MSGWVLGMLVAWLFHLVLSAWDHASTRSHQDALREWSVAISEAAAAAGTTSFTDGRADIEQELWCDELANDPSRLRVPPTNADRARLYERAREVRRENERSRSRFRRWLERSRHTIEPAAVAAAASDVELCPDDDAETQTLLKMVEPHLDDKRRAVLRHWASGVSIRQSASMLMLSNTRVVQLRRDIKKRCDQIRVRK